MEKQKVSEMQKNHTQEANYQWIDFYTEFADACQHETSQVRKRW